MDKDELIGVYSLQALLRYTGRPDLVADAAEAWAALSEAERKEVVKNAAEHSLVGHA